MAKFSIVRVDDVSYGHPELIKRLVYRVTMRQSDAEYVQKVAGRVLRVAKRRRFNAMSILMYRDASEVDGPHTVGEVVFAPHGDWARAHEVQAGNYESMELRIVMRELQE